MCQSPDDAPRGAVTTFCFEHGITRKALYVIRARAEQDGQAAALESSGLDHGPFSVHNKMLALGMGPVPSVASLAWIFRKKLVARL